MRRDGLGFPGLGHHEQLRQDRNALQVDAEGPQDLQRRMMELKKKRDIVNPLTRDITREENL
jgi:hypothetical protein